MCAGNQKYTCFDFWSSLTFLFLLLLNFYFLFFFIYSLFFFPLKFFPQGKIIPQHLRQRRVNTHVQNKNGHSRTEYSHPQKNNFPLSFQIYNPLTSSRKTVIDHGIYSLTWSPLISMTIKDW